METFKANGFTLIEVMITLAIAAIIAMIAIPTYTRYLEKSRRTEGQTALLELASKMERYYTLNHTYVGATLSNVNMPCASESGYYTLSMNNLSASTYTLIALPAGAQSSDSTCATLSITQAGVKSATGSASNLLQACW